MIKLKSHSRNPFGTTRFRIAQRLSSIEEPRTGSISYEDLLLTKPQVTKNLCPESRGGVQLLQFLEPARTEDLTEHVLIEQSDGSIELQTLLDKPELESLLEFIPEWADYPEIIEFEVALDKPKIKGKSYRRIESGQLLLPLGKPEKLAENCIHGIAKNTCGFCKKKAEETKGFDASPFDVFDLLFPILQPPLGEEFTSPLTFPPGEALYDYQWEGVRFLVENERALLADEMGLGKSIQAIFALRILFRMGEIRNCLVLCPKSVLTDWEKKLWKWAPELNRVLKISGGRLQRKIQWQTGAYVHIVTYDTFREDTSTVSRNASDGQRRLEWDEEEKTYSVADGSSENPSRTPISRKNFDLVILDEIQRLKNPSAKTTQAVRSLKAKRRWGLSGTPLENRLEDVISIFDYLVPKLILGTPDISEVREKIRPYVLRRLKKDARKDLREKVFDERWMDLTPSQREVYERIERDGVLELKTSGETVTVQHIFALIQKLKQICNIHPTTTESSKLEFLKDRLTALTEEGDKALVFSQYPEVTLKRLETELVEFSPALYYGKLSDAARDRLVDAFQDSEESSVLLISVRSCQGITLTRANYVFHFDLWWNPAVAAQAEDRAHRIGQEKTVFVTYLLTTNTIEERIHDILERKKILFGDVFDSMSDSDLSQNLTRDELFGLFGIEDPDSSKRESHAQGTRKTGKGTQQEQSPREFEELVAALFEKMGYSTKLTKHSGDGGVDVYAKRDTSAGLDYLAIQCKHYPKGKVPVTTARELWGVVQEDPSITKAVIATTGTFSKDCRRFCEGKRFQLMDGAAIEGQCERFGLV